MSHKERAINGAEHPAQPELEKSELRVCLDAVVEAFFRDDRGLYFEYDDEDLLGALYGALLEIGEDPDEVFEQYGITEGAE
jgi:hypothetical protein